MSHLKHIRDKVNAWIDKTRNGHLPYDMGWIAYKFKLRPQKRYGIWTTKNDTKETKKVPNKTDYTMINTWDNKYSNEGMATRSLNIQ